MKFERLPGALKVRVGGWLSPTATSKSLNLMPVDKALPLSRVVAWRQAFIKVNGGALDSWQSEMRRQLQALKSDKGDVEMSFQDDDYSSWMLSVAEIHITLRQKNEPLEEALHHDGAASLLHLGLTLFGRRTVTFRQEEVSDHTTVAETPRVGEDVVVPCEPGHIYLGGVTGARHQVRHQAYTHGDMWLESGFGPCSVTVMFRCTVWPNRGRNMKRTPSPAPVWNLLTSSIKGLLAKGILRGPTLQECKDEL